MYFTCTLEGHARVFVNMCGWGQRQGEGPALGGDIMAIFSYNDVGVAGRLLSLKLTGTCFLSDILLIAYSRD